MIEILFILILILYFYMAYKPSIDFTKDRETLLWYNYYGSRKYIRLFRF